MAGPPFECVKSVSVSIFAVRSECKTWRGMSFSPKREENWEEYLNRIGWERGRRNYHTLPTVQEGQTAETEHFRERADIPLTSVYPLAVSVRRLPVRTSLRYLHPCKQVLSPGFTCYQCVLPVRHKTLKENSIIRLFLWVLPVFVLATDHA